jgi:hypothetical protein
MTDWVILTAVKILKVALLGALSLVSGAVDGATVHPPCSRLVVVTAATYPGPVSIDAIRTARAPAPVAAPLVTAPTPPAEVKIERVKLRGSERIQRLVPPVRVEMTLGPDLLTPPRRDLSL